MINIIWQSIIYVTSDPWFIPSMAFTVMVGLFIGAVFYDGNTTEIRKFIGAMASLVVLIIMVNLTRAIPQIPYSIFPYKPIASATTTIIVSGFYLFGMGLGVFLVRKAHKGKEG
jgi:hypothetical protein